MQKFIALILIIVSNVVLAQSVKIDLAMTAPLPSNTPVRIQLLKPLSESKAYQLRNVKTQKTFTAQLLDSITLVFMADENISAGIHTYTISPTNAKPKQSIVTIQKKESGLQVTNNNKPVLFYHTKEAMPPADSPAYYRRSGFIHPLNAPSGKVLTDDFPADHTHQHGIFFAWTNTTFKKTFVDFWNQHAKKGTIEHTETIELVNGPVASQIKTSLRHISLEHGEVLREKWTITVYPVKDYFLFDLESEQVNVTKDTLFLNKYIYGGLAFRGSKHWNNHDKKNYTGKWNIMTSEGFKDSAANHTHARWVDASGTIEGVNAGATVFNHPSNYRYPQSIRVHAEMPYWTYAPVVDSAFHIAPGEVYRSKFRYYVHNEAANPVFIERLFTEWTNSANVKATYR